MRQQLFVENILADFAIGRESELGLNCIGSIVSGDWTNYCTAPIRRGLGNLKGKAKYSSKHRVFVGTWCFRKLRASPPGSPP